MAKADEEIATLTSKQKELAFDHVALAQVMKELADVQDRKEAIEEEWLTVTARLEELGHE
jgi:hypothetical protein